MMGRERKVQGFDDDDGDHGDHGDDDDEDEVS